MSNAVTQTWSIYDAPIRHTTHTRQDVDPIEILPSAASQVERSDDSSRTRKNHKSICPALLLKNGRVFGVVADEATSSRLIGLMSEGFASAVVNLDMRGKVFFGSNMPKSKGRYHWL
jgi:hypothetical protein